jgi:hypothetical protein
MTIAEARKVLSKYRINQLAEVAPYEIEEAVILALRILKRMNEGFIAKIIDADENWSEPEGDEVMLAQAIITAMVKE